MRAFAKKIGVNPSTLSRILSGKQTISDQLMEEISEKLMLTSDQKISLREASKRSKKLKTTKPFLIDTETFLKITDLYHYALLNLLKLKTFRPDFHWIARVLGKTETQVIEMWNRLIEVGMIAQDGNGRWVRTHANTTNIKKEKVPPQGYRDLQIQYLEQAIKVLKTEPFDRRDHSAIIIPIDSKMIPEARLKIAQFRKDMTAFMEPESADQVFGMTIALFPLTTANTEE
jgi:uncharacterized protein (TIGR02147 family)